MINKKINIDFSEVKYEDVKINIKDIIDNLCFNSIFQHILASLTPIIQIYYFRDFDYEDPNDPKSNFKFQSNFFLFAIAMITLQLVFSFNRYIHGILFEKTSKFFLDKKYYEIGDIFRKVVLISEILNIVIYFPIIYLINRLLGYFIFIQDTKSVIGIASDICLNKIYDYHYINFFTLLFFSFNNPLNDLLYTFGSHRVANLNSLLKFVFNLTFCRYFKKKNPAWYFMNGIAFANVFSEAFSFIFLLIAQQLRNPYPQAWVGINLQLFNSRDILDLISIFITIGQYTIHMLLHYWNEILLIIYSSLHFHVQCIEVVGVLMALHIFKVFFFSSRCMQRKTVEDINKNFNMIVINSMSMHIFNPVQYDQDSSDNRQTWNYQLMILIKSKIWGSIALDAIMALMFYIFYFLGVFGMICFEKIHFGIVLLFSLNGSIECLVDQWATLNKHLANKINYFFIILSYLISLVVFNMIAIVMSNSLMLLGLSMNLGNFILMFILYKDIQKLDLRIISLDHLLLNRKELNEPWRLYK